MQLTLINADRAAPELPRVKRTVPYRNSVRTMALREVQFAESSPEQRRERSARGLFARGGKWAIRRAPSWRRVGPRLVVAPRRVRELLLDALAIAIGLSLGIVVITIASLF
jgi:hypothetical protein